MQHGQWATNTHTTTRFRTGVINNVLCCFSLYQHGNTASTERFVKFCNTAIQRRSIAHVGAQPFLERGDASASFRLGLTTSTPGGGVSAVFNYLHKIIKIVEVLHSGVSYIGRWVGFLPTYH